jgi:hypothetical protein
MEGVHLKERIRLLCLDFDDAVVFAKEKEGLLEGF